MTPSELAELNFRIATRLYGLPAAELDERGQPVHGQELPMCFIADDKLFVATVSHTLAMDFASDWVQAGSLINVLFPEMAAAEFLQELCTICNWQPSTAGAVRIVPLVYPAPLAIADRDGSLTELAKFMNQHADDGILNAQFLNEIVLAINNHLIANLNSEKDDRQLVWEATNAMIEAITDLRDGTFARIMDDAAARL